MKTKKILKGADAVGVKVTQDKSFDKLSAMVLFPDKLKQANKVVTKLILQA